MIFEFIWFISITTLKEFGTYDIPFKEKFQVPVDCFRVFFFNDVKNVSFNNSEGWLNLNTYSKYFLIKQFTRIYDKIFYM